MYIPIQLIQIATGLLLIFLFVIMRILKVRNKKILVGYIVAFLIIGTSIYLQYQSRVAISYAEYYISYQNKLQYLEDVQTLQKGVLDEKAIDSLKTVSLNTTNQSDPKEPFTIDFIVTIFISGILGLIFLGTIKNKLES